MYSIISGGRIVALCDEPLYVRKNDSGIYVKSEKEDAIALSVSGDLYNINGGDDVPGAPEAVAVKVDGAQYVFQTREQSEDANEKNAANIDYLSMMSGIDLPEEEEASDEPEIQES